MAYFLIRWAGTERGFSGRPDPASEAMSAFGTISEHMLFCRFPTAPDIRVPKRRGAIQNDVTNWQLVPLTPRTVGRYELQARDNRQEVNPTCPDCGEPGVVFVGTHWRCVPHAKIVGASEGYIADSLVYPALMPRIERPGPVLLVPPEPEPDEVRYTFSLPCTVGLWGRSSDDREIRIRLASALIDQLQELGAEDVGSILENIQEDA
jgi:hypothetical protein